MTTPTVVPFARKSYEAKLITFHASGFEFHLGGTLDGFVDLAVICSNGEARTYTISCDDARVLIASLNTVVKDIQDNCLFDRDHLLYDRNQP